MKIGLNSRELLKIGREKFLEVGAQNAMKYVFDDSIPDEAKKDLTRSEIDKALLNAVASMIAENNKRLLADLKALGLTEVPQTHTQK